MVSCSIMVSTSPASFTEENFSGLCRNLAGRDHHLQSVIDAYGLPPMWIRPNSFETLVLTILEQQVSLASAYAAYKKLKEKIPDITPDAFLSLSDEDLRACYFSRQKTDYARGLAKALAARIIDLDSMALQDDAFIRTSLKKLKGIGDWTVDIYLIHALRRMDIFPSGDLALVNAIRMVMELPASTTKEDIIELSQQWKPYRTMATMIFWHYYIRKKKIKLQH